VFDNVLAGADDDRRDAILFKMSGGQTYGLMAEESQLDQQRCVGAVLH